MPSLKRSTIASDSPVALYAESDQGLQPGDALRTRVAWRQLKLLTLGPSWVEFRAWMNNELQDLGVF